MKKIRCKGIFYAVIYATFITATGCSSPDNDEQAPSGDEPTSTILVESNTLGTVLPNTISAPAGQSATFALMPNAGNKILSVDGCEGTLTPSEYVIVVPDDDCSVFVEFGPIEEQLLIDVFGEGQIASNEGTLCNSRETCELSSAANTPLQLTATAASGWHLSHWTGCDNVSGEICTVNMDGAEGVLPVFARDDDITLHPDVILLTDSQLDALQEADDASLVFMNTVEGLDTFEVGKILVSTRGDGFARRISQVIAISQSPVLIQTRNVPVSDIILDGTLVWKGGPSDGSDMEFIPAEGVTVVSESDNSRSLKSSINLSVVLHDEPKVKVKLDVELAAEFIPDFGLDISIFGIEKLRLVAGAKTTASAKLAISSPIRAVEYTKKLGTYKSIPIVVGPIVLIPEYEVYSEISTTVEGSVSVKTSFSAGGTIGVVKTKEQGWRSLNTLSAQAQAPTPDNLEIAFKLSNWTSVKANFLFYGLAGPHIQAGPIIEYQQKYTIKSATFGCFEASASYSAQAKIGGSIPIFRWEVTLPEATLKLTPVQISWRQDQFDRCKTDVYNPPQNVTTSLSEYNEITVNWEPPLGEPLVKYSIFRDNKYLAKTFGLDFIDTNTSQGVLHCYHVVGFDSKGRASKESDKSCTETNQLVDVEPPSVPSGLIISDITTATLKLSWSASSDNSDALAYLVYQGATIVARTVDVNARITQLLPGTRYCFTVAAIDATGNISTQSVSVCENTLPGDAGLWRMRIACEGRDYALENQVDLKSTQAGVVNFAGEGFDYPGTPVAYIVSGTYAGDTQVLSGRITYTFANDDNVRIDLFEVDLSTGDSGDVSMNQVQVTGCDTIVRFDQLDGVQTDYPLLASSKHKLPAMALNDERGISAKQY